jgi:hypothetical protein
MMASASERVSCAASLPSTGWAKALNTPLRLLECSTRVPSAEKLAPLRRSVSMNCSML